MNNILLHKALGYVEMSHKPQRALNIGPKDSVEPLLLESKGFSVDAVDKQFIDFPKNSSVNFFHTDIQDFNIDDKYNFVLARNVFYFLSRESMFDIFDSIKESLAKGGIFYFSVLGEYDAWVTEKEFSFFNKMEIMNIFAGYTCMNVVESQGWGTTYSGNQKYWHTFSFVFKK